MGGDEVQEQMQLLRELQGLDQELGRARQERQKLEGELTALGADQERVQVMVDSLTADLERLQGERREVAQALAQEQENVKRAEGRLPTIKTQKEYVAVLKEIDTAKKMNKELHDRIQAKDEEIGVLARDREEKGAELAAIAEKVAGRRAEIEAALAEHDRSLGEKATQRESLLDRVPLQVRKRYLMLLDRRAGVAVVEARKGTCLGCNMHLPPQLFNSLFTAREIQSCPHCNRLLFVLAE
jgi:predicted  nucleic acid-binding Zn-ribbon protein